MRESVARRYALALVLGTLGGLAVSIYNPVPHIAASLEADGEGVKLSLEVASHALERLCARA